MGTFTVQCKILLPSSQLYALCYLIVYCSLLTLDLISASLIVSMLFFNVADETVFLQQRNMEGRGEIGLTGDGLDTSMIGRMREDEYESRSGSDNFELDGMSGDEQDGGDDQRKRKKRYHRHTPNQIQELERYGFMQKESFVFHFELIWFYVIGLFC